MSYDPGDYHALIRKTLKKKKKKEEESKLLKKILTEFLLSLEGKNFNSQRAAEPFCPNT